MKRVLMGDEHKHENESREDIGMKKAEALTELKELISDIGEVMSFKGEDDSTAVYISVLADRKRLGEYLERVERYRIKYEMYLDMEAAAMVSYLHDYLYELRDFINVSYPNVPSLIIGAFVDRDIQMWSDEAERIVIRDMDAARTEIEAHSGDEWEALKNRIRNDLYERTALYHLQDPPEETAGEKDAVWRELIEEFRKY